MRSPGASVIVGTRITGLQRTPAADDKPVMRWALIAVVVGGLWLAWFTGQSAGVFKEMWVATSPMRQPPPGPQPAWIHRVQPDYVRVTGDHAERQVFAVTYSLDHPETIKTATLELEGRETGVLARMDVPVQASGTVRFDVDPVKHSFGPVVRFHATCPEGPSDWFTVGQNLPMAPTPEGGTRINGPSSIPLAEGEGHMVGISGKMLSAACAVEAEVDGSPAKLMNLYWTKKRSFQALLAYRDLGYRSVSPRYLELNLRITGAAGRRAAVQYLAFRTN